MDTYILNEKNEPVPEPDMQKWGAFFNDPRRIIARTDVGPARISTVFLGIDHAFGGGTPVLFETMIFNIPGDEYQERFCTYAEAVRGHAGDTVALVSS